MKDYEIIVESMTPCGGSKHAIRTIIEAEAEDSGGPEEERPIRLRRLDFYRRHGCTPVYNCIFSARCSYFSGCWIISAPRRIVRSMPLIELPGM